jgi:hypothetical protein
VFLRIEEKTVVRHDVAERGHRRCNIRLCASELQRRSYGPVMGAGLADRFVPQIFGDALACARRVVLDGALEFVARFTLLESRVVPAVLHEDALAFFAQRRD